MARDKSLHPIRLSSHCFHKVLGVTEPVKAGQNLPWALQEGITIRGVIEDVFAGVTQDVAWWSTRQIAL
jgi:hypothetical protein